MIFNPLDRDFIQTNEDFFFCIVGYIHPPERVISYLKYIPGESGKWKYENKGLDRVLPFYSAQAVINTFEFLKTNYRQYLFYDKYSDILFTAVPYFYIKKYYSSEDKLKEIFGKANLDPLQNKLKSFISELSDLSGVKIDGFGVTGSILLDIHNPEFSDLDITVFGYENTVKVKNTVKEIFMEKNSKISQLGASEAQKWKKDKVERFGMNLIDAENLFSRKWNMGIYDKTRFSIHPIKYPNEIDEKYGDKTFTSMGEIEIQGIISDGKKSVFLPAIYEVSEVTIVNGVNVEGIKEIVSYEGLFDSVAEKGERVRAIGQLELVKDKLKGIEYYRIVVGSRKGSTNEFLLLIR